MFRKLVTVSFLVHIALSAWYIDKSKANDIKDKIGNDQITRAYITLNREEESGKPVVGYTAVLHLIYSTPLVNKTSVEWKSITLFNGTFLFEMTIPKKAVISLSTFISDIDYKKFVLNEKPATETVQPVSHEEGEGEGAPGEGEATGPTQEERDEFFKALINTSDGSFLNYQEHDIKGSFKLNKKDEDNNCQLTKYQFFNGSNFVHLPIMYCDLHTEVDPETRLAQAKKALKGYTASPYNAIVIPNVSVAAVTTAYTQAKQTIEERQAEIEGKEGEEGEGSTTPKKPETEAGNDDSTNPKKPDTVLGKDGSTTPKKPDTNTGKDGKAGDSKKKVVTTWYKSGWFIALMVIFIVLVITGLVLTVLMVNGSKDKTLDYTS